MSKSRSRNRWVVGGLLVLAANLFGLAGWRWVALQSGRPDDLLDFQPSPLVPEYERASARAEGLRVRLQAGDPTLDLFELAEATDAETDLYQRALQDQTDRWEAAQRLEITIAVIAVLTGSALALTAAAWVVASGVIAGADARRRRAAAMPPAGGR